MTTARELIEGSLRQLGKLAEGETPSSDTMNDSLVVFNEMLDSWSLERLMIYSTQDQQFTWPADTATRTLGPSGDFVGNRPVEGLRWSSYFNDSAGGSGLLRFISEQEYNSIVSKDVGSIPDSIFVNPKFPNIEITLFPVPSESLEFHFISAQELTNLSNLSTEISFPPGYKRAFRTNLTCELASEFGVSPPEYIRQIAKTSKRNIKNVNKSLVELCTPMNLPAHSGGYDIRSDS